MTIAHVTVLTAIAVASVAVRVFSVYHLVTNIFVIAAHIVSVSAVALTLVAVLLLSVLLVGHWNVWHCCLVFDIDTFVTCAHNVGVAAIALTIVAVLVLSASPVKHWNVCDCCSFFRLYRWNTETRGSVSVVCVADLTIERFSQLLRFLQWHFCARSSRYLCCWCSTGTCGGTSVASVASTA